MTAKIILTEIRKNSCRIVWKRNHAFQSIKNSDYLKFDILIKS